MHMRKPAPGSDQTGMSNPLRAGKQPEKVMPKGNGMTIFHEDWMMEAASAGRWDKVEIQQNGIVVASLPYVIYRRFGTRTVGMPYYTHILGPVLLLPPTKSSRLLENSTSLIQQLIAGLPAHDRFEQVLAPNDECSVAFSLLGFTVEANYTFRMPSDQTPDHAMANMKGARRRDIVTTFDRLTVRQHCDLNEFIAVAEMQVKDQVSRYRFNLIEPMVNVAAKHEQVAMISAYDETGQNMATTILLYDSKVVYFWVTARNPAPGNRAYARLIWEAYLFAHARSLILDLDGYASLNGARYLADFGGEPVSRNRITRKNIRFRARQLVNDWTQALSNKI